MAFASPRTNRYVTNRRRLIGDANGGPMSSDAIPGAAGKRRTAARWVPILALVFCATLINYLDRTVFNIARPLFV